MNYESEDALSKINLAIYQHEQVGQPLPKGAKGFFFGSNGVNVVAQGDSWFDYLPGVDIIKWLKLTSGYKIKSFATGGDTLENMVYGTEFKEGAWTRKTPEFAEVLAEIKNTKPAFFLFSAGGNDIAGDEFAAFLNHADSNPPDLMRTGYVDYVINTVFKGAYENMIKRVKAAHPKVKIIFHGYGRAIPTGKGVVNFGNYRFIGPWIRPSMTKKNILDPVVQRKIVADFINKLNEMLKSVASNNTDVYYLDLRDHIKDDDWINELHLNNPAYRRVATLFEDLMDSLLSKKDSAIQLAAKAVAIKSFQLLEQSLVTAPTGEPAPILARRMPPKSAALGARSRGVKPAKSKAAAKRKS
ncbi:SGNH/GDSL hydrolase family protein [Pseudomonas sp. UMAB-40]|uniref:SGNH/GDSL hydrolase family protein n=1 Tax=Pseudomonas sp. UMAB-40 TaxID=1365407 RepID=UPI001C59ACD1|nr:SGNH/GDSL hydrolase family protein [Pseudomonas sp. UMAB-40]